MRRARWTAVLVAGIAAGTFPGAASAAFTNVERVGAVSATTSVNKSVTVTCPAGKRVTTAGADVTPGNGHVLIDDIRPASTLSSVTVRAVEDETGTTATWYVAAYAICAPAPAGLVRVAATSAASSAGKPVTATCPAGKRVLGTGAEVNGADGHLLLDGIRPSVDLTSVTVNALEDQTGTAANWTVTAYAICSGPVTGLQRTATTSAAGSDPSQVHNTPCPTGKALVGLGGEINSTYGQGVLDAIFPDAELETAGFAAFEDDTGNPNNWSLTTYAICAAQVERAAATSIGRPGGSNWGGNASCTPDWSLTGGGAEMTGGLGRAWLARIDPTEVSPFDHRQVVTLSRGTSPSEWSVTTYALCASPMADLTRVGHTAGAVDAQQHASVSCPTGKRVIGSGTGYDWDYNSGGPGPEVMLQGMVPSADLTGVTATHSERANQNGSWSVTAVAICATPPPGLQLVTRTSVRDLEEVKSVTATCPAGKHLLGTGGRVTPAEGWVILDDVRPNATLTSVTATGIHDPTRGNDPWSVSAYAICVNR